MAGGILVVQSRPSSPDEAADYHAWYEVHMAEVLQLGGFVSARRLEALDGESYVAVYEVEGDVAAAKAVLDEALRSGAMTRPAGVQLDPPPTVQWYRTLGA